MSPTSYRTALLRDTLTMAGVQGFEPRNARTKTWCLTAWRHPNKIKRIIIQKLFKKVKLKRYNLLWKMDLTPSFINAI